jgi:transketolase
MREMRIKILEASHISKEGHIPSALSILDLLYCIYLEFPATTDLELGKDFDFILSKGHASLALYAVLEEAGIIDNSWVDSFAQFDSDFGGHPDMQKVSRVSASTGSLGHGLPISVGKILANRILGKQKRIFCLIGDGEMNEGSIWESLLLASHHKLNELILLIDINHSTDRAVSLGDLESKMKAFGFQTVTVDGHNHEEILAALRSDSRTPTAILAKTIKGYGIEMMESNPAWHHLSPTDEELIEMIRVLK